MRERKVWYHQGNFMLTVPCVHVRNTKEKVGLGEEEMDKHTQFRVCGHSWESPSREVQLFICKPRKPTSFWRSPQERTVLIQFVLITSPLLPPSIIPHKVSPPT